MDTNAPKTSAIDLRISSPNQLDPSSLYELV